jgi:hypothetical protein
MRHPAKFNKPLHTGPPTKPDLLQMMRRSTL